jgi:hypothetical protein
MGGPRIYYFLHVPIQSVDWHKAVRDDLALYWACELRLLPPSLAVGFA